MAALAILIAFFSASQDVAIDAYRREILHDEELGLGSSFTMYGYRIAMLISGGVGIGFVGSEVFNLSWSGLYSTMAILMLLCSLITWWANDPIEADIAPKTLRSFSFTTS
jgi:PAT family beta-lactamase induction signal transducer AmpG